MRGANHSASAPVPPDGPDFELIELLFFAYRDFVGEPDRLLARHGFGRAHHRVLHFINRHQGLTVAELLDILEITKQSLARVLKDLVRGGFVEQRAGAEDRRQRLLFLTPRGQALAQGLAGMQGARIARALGATGAAHRPVIARFLAELIDSERGAEVATDPAAS
ncbi:MAG: MarR family transcriptional regulator [Hyphomicrobiales bacterium]|uniref:MarR family winged helix-turn-helix transcriptional regulator n=1 Tax=Rhabdaerophilum calidifontis TaxID=2604328 RepID=UPI001FE2E5F7|nr:MarR family transcriptional regulator [Rhabdaerophilum calidifontis]MCA1951777.1 MarR family transcriptional regulator [Hyphomicrobiales bacterium]